MNMHRTSTKRTKVRGVTLAVIALLMLGALVAPASAQRGVAHRLTSAHQKSGIAFRLDGHFTETYRNRGWVQTYGVVKAKNLGRRKLHVTCTILVKTGDVIIGADSVDLVVPGFRSRSSDWGVEGGDESGKISGLYKCKSE